MDNSQEYPSRTTKKSTPQRATTTETPMADKKITGQSTMKILGPPTTVRRPCFARLWMTGLRQMWKPHECMATVIETQLWAKRLHEWVKSLLA